MPVLFNEDDHYGFDQPTNNMVAAIQAFASWGYFDYRRDGEPFEDGHGGPIVGQGGHLGQQGGDGNQHELGWEIDAGVDYGIHSRSQDRDIKGKFVNRETGICLVRVDSNISRYNSDLIKTISTFHFFKLGNTHVYYSWILAQNIAKAVNKVK